MPKSKTAKPKRRESLTVGDVMNREIVTFRTEDSLTLLHDIMGLARIRHFPVVDANDRPVGIVSQRDIFRAALSHHLGDGTPEQRAHLNAIMVKDEMSTPLLTAEPKEPLSEAVRRMREHKVGALVVTEKGKLVGLVTETDLMDVLADLLEER